MSPSARKEHRTDTDPYDDTLLSLFIVDSEEHVVGESIGIDGKDLILKHKGIFYLIPLRSVKRDGKQLRLVKNIDWLAAKAFGERWKRENLDPLVPEKGKRTTGKVSKKRTSSRRKARPGEK